VAPRCVAFLSKQAKGFVPSASVTTFWVIFAIFVTLERDFTNLRGTHVEKAKM
jgi:hypothetical protein